MATLRALRRQKGPPTAGTHSLCVPVEDVWSVDSVPRSRADRFACPLAARRARALGGNGGRNPKGRGSSTADGGEDRILAGRDAIEVSHYIRRFYRR